MVENAETAGNLSFLRSLSEHPLITSWPITKIIDSRTLPNGYKVVLNKNNVVKPVSLDSQAPEATCVFCSDHSLSEATIASFHGWDISPNKYPKIPSELVLRSATHTSELTQEDYFTWMRFAESSGMTISYSPLRKSVPEHKHANAFTHNPEAPLFHASTTKLSPHLSITDGFEYPSFVITGTSWQRHRQTMKILNLFHDQTLQYVVAFAPNATYICPSKSDTALISNRIYAGYIPTNKVEVFESPNPLRPPLESDYFTSEELREIAARAASINAQPFVLPDNQVPAIVIAMGKTAAFTATKNLSGMSILERPTVFQTNRKGNTVRTSDDNLDLHAPTENPILVITPDSAAFRQTAEEERVSSDRLHHISLPDVNDSSENTFENQIPYSLQLKVAVLEEYFEKWGFLPKVLLTIGEVSPAITQYVMSRLPQTLLISLPDATKLKFDKSLSNSFQNDIKTKLFGDDSQQVHMSSPTSFALPEETAIVALFTAEEFTTAQKQYDELFESVGRITHAQIFPVLVESKKPFITRKGVTQITEEAVIKMASTKELQLNKIVGRYRLALAGLPIPIIIPEILSDSQEGQLKLQKLPDFEHLPFNYSFGEADVPQQWLEALSASLDEVRDLIPKSEFDQQDDYDQVAGGKALCEKYIESIFAGQSHHVVDLVFDIIKSTQDMTDHLPRFVSHRDPDINNVRVVLRGDALAVQMVDFEQAGLSPRGYDEAKIYTHMLLNDEQKQAWQDIVSQKLTSEELIYFWRTVAIRSLIEYRYFQRGQYDESMGAVGMDVEQFKSRYMSAALSTIYKAQEEINMRL